MKAIRFNPLILVLILIALSVISGPACGAIPPIAGWSAAGEGGVYHRDTLWEFINGGAEQYLAYGFVELQVDDFSKGGITFTLFIYDMGTPLNAYGIYQAQRSPKARPLAIGGEAVVVMPYQCLLYKDRYYVIADLYDGEMTAEVGARFLKAVANALPGSDAPPALLAELPEKKRIPGAVSYTPEGFLGLGNLKRCLHAEYQLDKKTRVTGFVVLPSGSQSIDKIWNRLAEKWTASTYKKSPLLIRKIPYKGPVGLIKSKEAIYGISGLEDETELKKKLRDFSRMK
jgi:Family of unknown function (DUF6599)